MAMEDNGPWATCSWVAAEEVFGGCYGYKIQLQAGRAIANMWITVALSIMQIWLVVCQKVSLPIGLDYRCPTVHSGIMS